MTRKPIELALREVGFVRLPGRWVEGRKGVKLAVVEVDMPEWLAKKERLK